jgi:four helix bundle protein
MHKITYGRFVGGKIRKGRKGEGVQGSRGEREQGKKHWWQWRRGGKMKKGIQSHRELDVYKLAFEASMKLFELSKTFPIDEQFSLMRQIRRASRSVCANLAEAWRKRRYRAVFQSKLSDCEGEAAEVQTWIEFAVKCDYLDRNQGKALYEEYDQVIGKLVRMINHPDPWVLHGPPSE